MSEPLYLQSEEALLGYFKRFLSDKPKATRLDGKSSKGAAQGSAKGSAKEKEGAVMAVFRFSIDGKRYKILGSTSRKAIEEFVSISEEHGDASMALKTFGEGVSQTVILSTRRGPEGWVCMPFVEKAKDSLKIAA